MYFDKGILNFLGVFVVLLIIFLIFKDKKKTNIESEKDLTPENLLRGNFCFDSENKVTFNKSLVKKINISHQNLTKIPNLNDFNLTLECLLIHNNKIQDIENLDYLINLKTLTLDHNKIGKIEGLDKLIDLEFLSLNNNNIHKLEGLNNCVNLKQLHVENNNIEKIDGISHLTKLKDFIFSNNK